MKDQFLNYCDNYKDEGVTVIPDFFSKAEMNLIDSEVKRLIDKKDVPRVYENDSKTIRSIHNCEVHSNLFKNIISLPRMVNLIKEILHDDIYLQQFKINLKYAFNGEIWQWHQDYSYYYNEDKIQEPRLTNAVIFLDDINEFNAPLYFMSKSYHDGLISEDENSQFYELVKDDGWEKNFKSEMKYKLSNNIISSIASKYPIKSAKGTKGSLMLLHPNTVHASPPNISPFDRRMIFITYNSVQNRPDFIDVTRKGIASSAKNEQIVALSSDSLGNI